MAFTKGIYTGESIHDVIQACEGYVPLNVSDTTIDGVATSPVSVQETIYKLLEYYYSARHTPASTKILLILSPDSLDRELFGCVKYMGSIIGYIIWRETENVELPTFLMHEPRKEGFVLNPMVYDDMVATPSEVDAALAMFTQMAVQKISPFVINMKDTYQWYASMYPAKTKSATRKNFQTLVDTLLLSGRLEMKKKRYYYHEPAPDTTYVSLADALDALPL